MLQHSADAPLLSRREAAASGLSRFYTGRTCERGHLAERYVSNRQCVACNAAEARRREAVRGVKDPSFRMYRNAVRRAGMALKGVISPVAAVGCDHATLRDHISGRFRTGMTWDRYRQWEVDHIVPLSLASDTKELIDLCHYANLQPLWRRENRAKGGA